jgi:hypothetical protein
MAFSNPSPRLFEKGRLFGSAQTLRTLWPDAGGFAFGESARATHTKAATRSPDPRAAALVRIPK